MFRCLRSARRSKFDIIKNKQKSESINGGQSLQEKSFLSLVMLRTILLLALGTPSTGIYSPTRNVKDRTRTCYVRVGPAYLVPARVLVNDRRPACHDLLRPTNCVGPIIQ